MEISAAMGFSVTQAAARFDQSTKSGADLRVFYEQDPKGAAVWLSEITRASTNAPTELQALAKASVENAPVDQLVELVRQAIGSRPDLFDAVSAAGAAAQAQAQGAAGMGWSAAAPGEPAAAAPVDQVDVAPLPAALVSSVPAARPGLVPANFVGHLQKTEAGVVQFKTATGTFDVDLSTTDWRDEIETAFLRNKRGEPQQLTMKGFPSADGTRIYAQQFAPGADPNFVAARVRIEGERVFLATIGYGATDPIEVTNPELVGLLRGDEAQGLTSYALAGVILPGVVQTDPVSGAKTYAEMPQGFFILGRAMSLNVGSDEAYDYHDLDTGYYRATGVRAPKGTVVPPQSAPGGAKWDANDVSHGSTNDTDGPRTFFYAKILPHNEKFPEGIRFRRVLRRRLEITAVADQGDNGIHSRATSPMSNDFGMLARTVPASVPEHTAAQSTIDPTDD